MAEIETLLGSSSIYLFGKPLKDLILKTGVYAAAGMETNGENRFLRNQLENKKANLARIFSFSFDGALFELARPTIFLVHGAGIDPDDPAPTNIAGQVEYKRLSRSPGSSATTGLGLQAGAFALGMRVWIYDKGDFSMRLDIETGTFEQILLAMEAPADPRGATSGVMARSSGGMARSSGSMARSSGWKSRRTSDSD